MAIDEFNSAEFNVYPNPADNVWNIRSNQSINSIQIFDVLGKQVMTLTPNSETVSIKASGLTNGIYFVKLSSAIGTKSIKLIKK